MLQQEVFAKRLRGQKDMMADIEYHVTIVGHNVERPGGGGNAQTLH